MESERYAERMGKQYGLELEYRVFTGGAHLLFGSINMGLSVGGMYFGGRYHMYVYIQGFVCTLAAGILRYTRMCMCIIRYTCMCI